MVTRYVAAVYSSDYCDGNSDGDSDGDGGNSDSCQWLLRQ